MFKVTDRNYNKYLKFCYFRQAGKDFALGVTGQVFNCSDRISCLCFSIVTLCCPGKEKKSVSETKWLPAIRPTINPGLDCLSKYNKGKKIKVNHHRRGKELK
jgi:hypothetical protein